MKLEQFSFDNNIGFLTYLTSRLLALDLSKNFSNAGLNVTSDQYRILYKIWEHKGIMQKKLVEILHQDKSMISRLIMELISLGYIERNYSEGSAKSYFLKITAAGTECLSLCIVQATNTLNLAMNDLSPREISMFKSLLEVIIKNILTKTA